MALATTATSHFVRYGSHLSELCTTTQLASSGMAFSEREEILLLPSSQPISTNDNALKYSCMGLIRGEKLLSMIEYRLSDEVIIPMSLSISLRSVLIS